MTLFGTTKLYVQRDKKTNQILGVYVRIPADVWTDSGMFLKPDDDCSIVLEPKTNSITVTKVEERGADEN